jgi:hypothetical protein
MCLTATPAKGTGLALSNSAKEQQQRHNTCFPSCFYARALLLLSTVSVQLQCSLCSAFRFLRRAAKYAALDSAGTRASAFASYQGMLFFMAILALKFSNSMPRRFHDEER